MRCLPRAMYQLSSARPGPARFSCQFFPPHLKLMSCLKLAHHARENVRCVIRFCHYFFFLLQNRIIIKAIIIQFTWEYSLRYTYLKLTRICQYEFDIRCRENFTPNALKQDLWHLLAPQNRWKHFNVIVFVGVSQRQETKNSRKYN